MRIARSTVWTCMPEPARCRVIPAPAKSCPMLRMPFSFVAVNWPYVTTWVRRARLSDGVSVLSRYVHVICPIGCTIVISNAQPAATKMSVYFFFCSAVILGESSCGKGSARVAVVLPLIASMLGPYIAVARVTSLGVTVVFCIIPLAIALISFPSGGFAMRRWSWRASCASITSRREYCASLSAIVVTRHLWSALALVSCTLSLQDSSAHLLFCLKVRWCNLCTSLP